MKLCTSSYLLLVPLVFIINTSCETPNKWKCDPPTFQNGRVKLMSKGRTARFKCNPTYQLLGEKYTACIRGRWDSKPRCVKPGCKGARSLNNGQILESYRGAVVKFMCNPGFALYGSPSIFCNGAFWNGSVPICKASEKMAQTWCDFESQDLCGWTQDPQHNLDWSRQNFQTPPDGTGPSFDHTLGPDKGGYYMFIKSSSTNTRMENNTARLFSPVYTSQLSTGQPSCFILWYHMYGAATGSLHVYVKPENIEFDGTLSPSFIKTGDQGNQWYQAIILLPTMNESFQVIIEAEQGSSFDSAIAIDDVKIANGSECVPTATDLRPPIEIDKQDDGNDIYDNTESCRIRCQNMDSEVKHPPQPFLNDETNLYPQCGCEPECQQTATCCPDYSSYCMLESPPEDIPLQTKVTFHPPPPLPPLPPIPLPEVSLPPNTTQIPLTTFSSSNKSVVITELPIIRYKPLRSNWTQDGVQEQFNSSMTEEPSKRIPIPTEPTPLILQPPTALIVARKPTLQTEKPLTTLIPTAAKTVRSITTMTPMTSTIKPSSTTTSSTTTNVFRIVKIKTSATTLAEIINKTVTTITAKTIVPTVPTRKNINVPPVTSANTTLQNYPTTVKTITFPTRKAFRKIDYIPPTQPVIPTEKTTMSVQSITTNKVQDVEVEKTAWTTTSHLLSLRGQAWIDARRGKHPRQKQLMSISGIVGILAAVTLTIAAVGIGVYFVVRNRRRKRMESCMSEDSDVRFLTSDEALDFSLAKPIDFGDDDL